jgi:hypothetical protein
MTGFSPPPPPQAARAFVRQLFQSRRARRPLVLATLIDDAGEGSSTLEFVNHGAPVEDVACAVPIRGQLSERHIGSLGAREVKAVRLPLAASGEFESVWACGDRKGRRHVWSYDGRHYRRRKNDRITLSEDFQRMYPNRLTPST